MNSLEVKAIHYAIGERSVLDSQHIQWLGMLLFFYYKKNALNTLQKILYTQSIHQLWQRLRQLLMKLKMSVSPLTFGQVTNSTASFICFAGHCVNQNFELRSIVLCVMPCPESHTATKMCTMSEDVL